MEEMSDAIDSMGADYDSLVTELSGDTESVLKKMGFSLDDFKIPFLGNEEEPEPEATTEEAPQQEDSTQPMETLSKFGQLTNIVPIENFQGIGRGNPSLPGTTSMRSKMGVDIMLVLILELVQDKKIGMLHLE